MNNEPRDTTAWILQSWVSFVIAVGASAVGIYHLPCDAWSKSFLAISFFFTVAASFTLAKTLRDNLEHARFANRVKNAKAERILREYEDATAE